MLDLLVFRRTFHTADIFHEKIYKNQLQNNWVKGN